MCRNQERLAEGQPELLATHDQTYATGITSNVTFAASNIPDF